MKVNIGPYNEGPYTEDQIEKFERIEDVQIDYYDTWNLDHTLALIIIPCLKQLKETTNAAPEVDNEDVPDELKMPEGYDIWDNDGNVDDHWFERWNYVLDEMVWAFQEIINNDYYVNVDWSKPETIEKIDKINERINNGLRLFGKYYRGLWD